MEELSFIKRKVGMVTNDVSLRIYKTKGQRDKSERISVAITFYNETENFVTGNKSEYMVVAILKDRMYFKVSNAAEGYKVSGSKDHAGKRIQISANVCPALVRFVEVNEGEYPLKFDPDRGLHYILCD